METVGNGPDLQRAMEAIDKLLDNHGVETLSKAGYDEDYSSYWGNSVAIYSNSGDTYNSTILFDLVGNRWMVTTVGDFVERHGDKYGVE